MADNTRLNDSAHRRAQIIASQALREAAATPTNWRARKRRSFPPTWSTPVPRPTAPPAEPAATATSPSEPRAKK